jgi:glucose-1-phosphatase
LESWKNEKGTDMVTENITTILFDLGGVIFELGGIQTVCDWSRERLLPEQLLQRWLESPAVRRFESGRIAYPQFRKQLKAELGLAVNDDEYDRTFTGWIRGIYPGAEDLLDQLRKKYTVACFSNTNAVHWEILMTDYNLPACFEKRFASFEMGLVKPDKAAFLHVLEALGQPPETVVFLDDSPANVSAASGCAMPAVCVKGIEEARQALSQMGLI